MPAPRIVQESRGLRAVSAWTAPQMLPRFAPPLWLAGRHVGEAASAAETREAVLALDRGKMQPLALPDVEAGAAIAARHRCQSCRENKTLHPYRAATHIPIPSST